MLASLGIRKKLILAFLVLVIAMSSVFALSSYFRIVAAMHSELRARGVDLVKTFAHMVAPYIYESDYITIYDSVEKLVEDSDIRLAAIVEVNGNLWLTTSADPGPVDVESKFYRDIINSQSIGHRFVKRETGNAMEFVSPITALGKTLYLLKIEISLARVEKQAADRIRDAMVIGVGMVIFAAFLGVFLSRLLTKPIEKLVRGTNEIADGNLSHRIDVTSADEIGTLSVSYNLMAKSLERELAVRKKAEASLKKHRDSLEETVKERTAQLTQANETLTREVEEHKKTEAALRESEERHKRFSEVTNEGIVFHDDNGIIDSNSKFNEMFGYSSGELTRRSLVSTICLPKYSESIGEILRNNPQQYVETEGRRKDGSTMPIEIKSRSVVVDKTPWMVTSVSDTTERRQLEHKLHQAQKMESIGLMAGVVAHDLNNILSGIVSYPEVLLMGLPEESHMKKPLEMIRESGTRAAEVVFDLLTVARGAASAREPRNLNHLIEEYLRSPEYDKLEKSSPHIALQKDLDPNLFNISCSPTHVKKAIMNLISNAAEAIIGEGRITVSTRNQYVDEPIAENMHLAEGEYVVFSVSDSGPGISKNDITHIFEPFYSKKKMGKTSGSGLGLTVVWNTAEDHDGGITVESDATGTTFLMYFPSTRETLPVEPTMGEVESLNGNGEKLLVIDDDEGQQIITSKMLEALNYSVAVVGSGEEAVEYLQKYSVDLLILDMILGTGMTGRQTYQKIKQFYPALKAIIVSGFSADTEVKETQKLGAGQFVKKPYTLRQIGQAIKEELHS